MRARIQALALASLTLFSSTTARADLVPPGRKSVNLSIRADGEIASGQALVLDKTFRGADVIAPGKVVPIEWHPLHGPMRLVLLDAGAAAKVEKARETMDRDTIKGLTSAGTPCSEPFEGVRTVEEALPTAEVRWTFAVKVEGTSCTGTLVRTEHLAKDGTVVSVAPSGAPPAPVAPAASQTAEPSSAPAVPAERSTSGSGCGACAIGHVGHGPAHAALLVLGAIAALRRRQPQGGRSPSPRTSGREARGSEGGHEERPPKQSLTGH